MKADRICPFFLSILTNTVSDYLSIIENFNKIKVLVVGDVMLDRYWWGNVSRISPEAPVPVVNLKKTSLVVGGAANVAANIKGLGAEVYLIGAIGCDEEAGIFINALKKIDITAENLLQIENRPTTIKTRVVAHNQHVVRIDQEDSKPIETFQMEKIFECFSKLVMNVDIVVISDYAKGLLTEELMMRLITICRSLNKSVIVDPKGKNYKKYQGANLITPNQTEAVMASGLESEINNSVELAGKKLISKYNFDSILITRGEDGMTLFQKNNDSIDFKASARKVYDVTGAGDTVIAALAVAYSASNNLILSSDLANSAAGLVVEEIGTTTITKQKLINYVVENNND